MKRINIEENGLYLVFEIDDDNQVKFLHFNSVPFDENNISAKRGTNAYSLVEVMLSGCNRPLERHGNKYIACSPSYRLKFKKFTDNANTTGRTIDIVTYDEPTGIEVTSHFQFYDGLPVARCYTTVKNTGSKIQTLEYVSSFSLAGIEKEGIQNQNDKIKIHVCHNSWQREIRWRRYSLKDLGIEYCQANDYARSSKAFNCSNTGNWSTKEFIPMGLIENTEVQTMLFWQIEHNGSWHSEISDYEDHMYLRLSGATEIQSHWSKKLAPDESFDSVPCCVGSVVGGFDDAIGVLTQYRRKIRRRNLDNQKLFVIFNDYMNCLWGNPTEEKEIPLIDAAAEAGCEYYCIDAGWYADCEWWDEVGEWKPSVKRFPNGLKKVTDYIRSKGMVAGLWLEIEVIGINSPKLKDFDDECFFIRHGERVYDRSRLQLDFRNPKVIAHANEVIDRLVKEYGVGYIKMDYNIEPSIGTEINADSFGDGLMQHEKAYLEWLDSVFKRHKNLIIENCSSGGQRMDYAMLSRHSIQSTSDQDDYKMYCSIAANSPTVLCPEQSAVWTYPKKGADREETIFNMINAMLLRIHQSGHLAEIEPERKQLVRNAIEVYKSIRADIKNSLPFYPLGVSDFDDPWICLGLDCGERKYIALWKCNAKEDTVELPIGNLSGNENQRIRMIFPTEKAPGTENCEAVLYPRLSKAVIKLSGNYSARLFIIERTNE